MKEKADVECKDSSVCCGVFNGKYVIWVLVLILAAVAFYSWGFGSTPTGSVVYVGRESNSGVLQVVEYSDFMCPYCGRAAQTISLLKEKYGGRIEVVYKHFPLSFHPGADKAAEASECARDQGMFWEYHDLLFEGYSKGLAIGRTETLKTIAGKLNLDMDAFNECLDSGAKAGLVRQHIGEAERLGVEGTPTFFIGDEMVVGAQPIEIFERVIESKLG